MRTMKNSSMALLNIDRKRIRATGGTSGSSASASTRESNSNWLISGLSTGERLTPSCSSDILPTPDVPSTEDASNILEPRFRLGVLITP